MIKCTELPIKTNTGRVESVVKALRENVLQMPKRVSMNKGEGAEQNFQSPENHVDLQQQNVLAVTLLKPRLPTQKRNTDKTDGSAKISRNLKKSSIEGEKISVKYERKNFIKRNITSAAKTKKIEYDTDDYISVNSSSISSKRSSTISENSKRRWEPAAKKLNYNVISTKNIEESNEDNAELNVPSYSKSLK